MASQESNPDGLDFSSDGRKMYVLGPSGRVVFEYDLGTAWEVNTASYNSVSHSVSSEDSSPYVLKFSSDGTKFYISGPSNDTIYQYSLSDAWDLSSAVEYTGKHIDISSQEGNIQSIYFNSDGTRMYVVGTTNESVFQYDLDTAWDVSTATYIGNDIVLSEASQSYGSRISPDGTKFYAAHTGGSKYYSYDLTVPYNIGSAVYTEQRASITAPREMVFSPDGTKLFVYNQAAGYIYQHPLSTAWDITTLGASEESLSIGTATDGLRFEPDGSALYYIDNTNHYIYRRELTTAWDISSVSALHYLTGVTTSVYSFDFKEDMTKLFVINSSKSVYSYDIPEGWSSGDALLNQTVLKSFSSDIGTCCSMKFGDGGHSLYFANSNTEELMKYSMNTAYDVENAEKTNTALYVGHEQINVTGFHIADDNVYICGISSAYCHQYPMLESRKNTSLLSEEFDAVSSPAKADVIIWSEAIDALTLNTDFCAYIGRESAKDCTTDYETDDRIHVASHGYQNGDQILFFLPGGTYPYGIEKRTPYFVVNSDTDDFEISETVGGDSIDIRSDKTATLADSEYTGVSLKAEAPLPVGFYFKPDGLKFYVIDNNYDYVRQYSMTTAWDLSTASYDDISSVSVASEETNAYGFTFSTDGMHFFIVGVTTQEVYQYDMTTAWDIETATYSNNSFSVSGYDTSPMGVEFNSDGTKMYITGNSGDDITMFSLSSPWDLSVTPTFTTGDVFSISGQEGASQSMRFNIDGTEMYMIGRSNDTLFKYSLSTAWDIKTATYSGDSFSVADQHGNPQDLFFNPDQTKLFIVGFNPDEIHEYRIFINDSLTVQRVFKAELSKIADATVGQMLYGTADISNQASDTKMQYFLKSNNRKAIDIYGVSLQWGS